jgi:hypothetical protein
MVLLSVIFSSHGSDGEETCPRGLAKMQQRALNWLTFSKRRVSLSLAALPPNQMPRSTRDATGYFLFVHKVNEAHVT